MSSIYKELKKGAESAKIRSRKQAIITGLLHAIIISASIFNDFNIFVKLLIFISLTLILGAIMSSDWMQRKFKTSIYNDRVTTQMLVDSLNAGVLKSEKK